MQRLITYITISCCLSFTGCVIAPDFSDVPEITFISFSKSQIKQGDLNNDSVFVTIEFTDGNGDIGAESNESTINMFVIDNRNGEIYDNVKLPKIPQDGAGNGVKGTIIFKMFNGCCLYEDGTPNCTAIPDATNDVTFDIYIKDNAENQSNTITTPPLTFLCQ